MKVAAVQTDRLPWVQAQKAANGAIYFYYRRDGRRKPLPGPEGSAAFLEAYDRIHAEFETAASPWGKHTIGAAITYYLGHADFTTKADATKRNYRQYLEEIRTKSGNVSMLAVDYGWADGLRNRLAADPYRWNRIRGLLAHIWKLYGRANKGVLTENPWEEVDRLEIAESDQNRRWTDEELSIVLREATPEFRALVLTLLYTGQREEDVLDLRGYQYDEARRTLTVRQKKTGKIVVLHVPEALALVFESMRGRHPKFMLCSPRGRAWSDFNAQETLLSLRNRLKLGDFTLHGLRSTGISHATEKGAPLRSAMAVTGHTSERTVSIYLRGVAQAPMARQVQTMFADHFDPVVDAAMEGANQRSYSGTTGKAAAKAGIRGESRRKRSPDDDV